MSNVFQLKNVNKSLYAKNELEAYAKVVEKELTDYFDHESLHIFGVSKKERQLSKNIFEHIEDYVLRPAKRLRASFVYNGYELLGGQNKEGIIKASMCVELIHAGLLVHDDFMDQDITRRGKFTTHEYYSQIHHQNRYFGDSKHYGASMAVNIGDAALFLGHQILGESPFDPAKKVIALNRLSRGIVNTALGQAFDVTMEVQKNAVEKDILDLHFAKTAIYTYENPLHIGAILAGASEGDLSVISKYAIPGGIAFQLQDDILGFFGDSKKTGKASYSDLKEGKTTLLIIKALENGSKGQVNRLMQIWGKRDLTRKEADEARQIVADTGSLEYSKKISIKFAKKAQESIPLMLKRKWNKKAIDYLDGIAQYMIERDL